MDVASRPRLERMNDGAPYFGEAPRHQQRFELSFDTQEDMEFCMAAQARVATREQSAEGIARLKGLFTVAY
jgi:hypothetical protein